MPAGSGLLSAKRRSASWTIPWGDMTFARALEASYLTGAPGTGASAFLSWASSGVLREEDRGDGAGALALLEGERTNQIVRSQEIDDAAWTTAGSVTVTSGQDSPDSGTTAERVQCAGGTNIRYQNLTPGSGYRSLSAWVRAASGTVDHNIYVYDGSAAYYAGENGISTTYRRLSLTQSLAAGAGNVGACDGRTGGGVSAGSRDAYVALVQLEAGKFPSSAIRTAGATVTRPADSLTKTSGIPSGLFTGKGEFANFSPIYSVADLVLGDVAWLLSIGGASNGIRVYHDGTDCYLEALVGGSVVAASQPQSWSAHDVLGEVSWDPAAGLVYVNGVAGPAGTPWSWTPGSIRVGGVYSGTSEAYARLGTLQSW